MATGYSHLLDFVWTQVEKHLERKDDQTASFVRDHRAKVILNEDKLKECYHIFGAPGGDGLTEDVFIKRVHERRLHKFLIIPLYRRLPQDALEAITLKLVATDDWPIHNAEGRRLDKLPAELSQLEEIFGHGSPSAGMFYTQQATFCAAVIRKGEEVVIEDSNCERLPYIRQTFLGKGSVGDVWETEVAKNHFYDVAEDQYNSIRPKVIARKDYIINTGFHPEGERKILQQIMKSSGHENIVTSLGSMRIKSKQVDGSTTSDTFSLFMPKADCDLRQYMIDRYQQAPGSWEKKERLLACAAGLARGLKFLHHEMTTPAPERRKLICYHMDLKPANILVFFPGGDEDRMIWKLSDFGMSSIKISKRHGQDQNPEEKGFSGWFKPRSLSQVVDPSASETVAPRGQGTYLAPESVTQNAEMGRASDVWSLGCVVSELFAYLEGGKDAVVKYSEERRRQLGGLGDRFFLHTQGLTPPKDHPVIKTWHDSLIEKAKLRHVDEGQVIGTILKGLEERVLTVDKGTRCGAGDVEKMLDDTCEGYRSLMRPLSLSKESPGPSGARALIRTLTSRWASSHASQISISKSYLGIPHQASTSPRAFKDCTVSSDGGSVAYWTGKEIWHCTPGSNGELSPFVYHLKPSEQWNSVALTRKYLIASTTSASNTFECYIINIMTRPGEHLYHYISIPQPQIHRLILAEDSEQLVCHLGPRDGSGLGSLCYAMISDLTSGPPLSSDALTRNSVEVDRTIIDHEWPAGTFKYKDLPDMPKLSPSGPTELTHLFASRGLHEQFMFVVSSKKETAIYHLPSGGEDSASARVRLKRDQHTLNSFLTTIAPLSEQPACAFVTHREHFHRQHLLEDRSPMNFSGRIPNFKVRKLIPGWSVDELFALGTKSMDATMRLVSITTPDPTRRVVVKEIAKLENLYQHDECVVTLPEPGLTINGAKFIIVASIGPDRMHRRTVYRVDITPRA